jgi:hypothetical protein
MGAGRPLVSELDQGPCRSSESDATAAPEQSNRTRRVVPLGSRRSWCWPRSGSSRSGACGGKGRRARSDYDYVIEIRGVASDGRLDARYLNPSPINVSRAEAKRENGRLTLLVEMRDQNHPGSYYTLAYDPGRDTLAGVYHHLGLQQEFEVAFSRSSDERSAP